MDQVLLFDKSLKERLEEFNQVLSGSEVLPVSKIQKEWAFYLELTVDPNGWQAVWKIQRRTCELLGISFPSVVLVFVLGLELHNLTALVKILAVQDDVHLPEKLHAPLMHLWPTKNQDKSVALNMDMTANGLDMFRFFYTHIFMPWDLEDDDSSDWREKHLESRLRLYYDMKNGNIPRSIVEHLNGLFAEGRKLQTKRELLESDLERDEIDVDEDINDKSITDLMEIHIRMLEIKNEVDILENPVFRKIIVKKHKETQPKSNTQVIWLIYEQGSVDDFINFLAKVKESYPTETVKFCHPLDATLENANPNDIFILNESRHSFKMIGVLEMGGKLKGLYDRDKTIITTNNQEIMLDFNGDVWLENLTIDASVPQCAIIVRRGTLVIKNCKIKGDGKSSTHQGIILLAGSSLQMNECEISNFSTAIVGNSNSLITIRNSEIHDVNFGLKIYDNCTLKVEQSSIRNCTDYGICVEVDTFDEQMKTGDFEALNIIPKLKLEGVKGENNVKGNATINQKTTLKPVEDLFENPDLDPTICKDEDEEMSFGDTTLQMDRLSPVTV